MDDNPNKNQARDSESTLSMPDRTTVLCPFGSTKLQARRDYELLEQAVRVKFPSTPIHWAYTSNMVRQVLASNGVTVESPCECIERLHSEGLDVVLQPLLVTPGQEFENLLRLRGPNPESLVIGRPLLDSPSDYERVVDFLIESADPALPTVVVAHGNDNDPRFNECQVRLIRMLRERNSKLTLASLEGWPGDEPLRDVSAVVQQAGAVHFIPLLLVAGDHVQNDLMGEEPSAWHHRFPGAHVTCGPGLLSIPVIRQIFVEHLVEAWEQTS